MKNLMKRYLAFVGYDLGVREIKPVEQGLRWIDIGFVTLYFLGSFISILLDKGSYLGLFLCIICIIRVCIRNFLINITVTENVGVQTIPRHKVFICAYPGFKAIGEIVLVLLIVILLLWGMSIKLTSIFALFISSLDEIEYIAVDIFGGLYTFMLKGE